MAVVQGLYVLPRSLVEYGRALSPVFARQAVYMAIFLGVGGAMHALEHPNLNLIATHGLEGPIQTSGNQMR